MSDTLASLRRKIDGADKLKSVVRTMKALAASSIGQYETAVHALAEYERTVELGLIACFRRTGTFAALSSPQRIPTVTGAIVFGSDQGLVGQFNDMMADFVMRKLGKLPGEKRVWVVGQRLHARLADAGLQSAALYAVPNSVDAITQLVGRIQVDIETGNTYDDRQHVQVFHNRPQSGAQYQPVCQSLLPLDDKWRRAIAALRWPTPSLPETLGNGDDALRAFIREHLFILLFKACAESLASENASRLAAMQRAEQNIDTLSVALSHSFYRLRQGSIDEELFDVVAGFNALEVKKRDGNREAKQSKKVI